MFYLLLPRGGSVNSLVKALFRLIVVVLVVPYVLGGEALQFTHVVTEEESHKIRENKSLSEIPSQICIQPFYHYPQTVV